MKLIYNLPEDRTKTTIRTPNKKCWLKWKAIGEILFGMKCFSNILITLRPIIFILDLLNEMCLKYKEISLFIIISQIIILWLVGGDLNYYN